MASELLYVGGFIAGLSFGAVNTIKIIGMFKNLQNGNGKSKDRDTALMIAIKTSLDQNNKDHEKQIEKHDEQIKLLTTLCARIEAHDWRT